MFAGDPILPKAEPTPTATAKKTVGGIDLSSTIDGRASSDPSGDGGNTPVIAEGTARCFGTTDVICVADRAAPAPQPGEPTLSDIATFPVTVTTAHNQPTGWGVVGKPTNFFTKGGTHEVTGTLLNRPATVRFTPVAWHWDYGDGSTDTKTTGGGPWTEETRFRPTRSFHVYDEKADYTVTLLIDYAAEYQYAGQPWRPVAGLLRVRANDLNIITWRVKTVLVAYDCTQDPKGLGCPGTLTR